MFENRVIAITGTLKSMTRKKALALVHSVGGRTTNHVNRNTDFLVVGSLDMSVPTEKKEKALELIEQGEKIKIISEDVFCMVINYFIPGEIG